MKILITGAAGFIGYHLSKKLLRNNISVIGVDNLNSYYDVNLKNARKQNLESICRENKIDFHFFKNSIEEIKELDEIFNRYKPKIVINLAAQAGVRYSITNPDVYIKSNLLGFGNILECCKKYRIENLLYASSSSVYGGNINMPFNERQSVNHPVSLYAATKKANELMAHTYSSLYGIPSTGLRFFTVYGPWGRPDMALFLFTKAIIEGKPIKIFNNGDMMRDFTYIDDIVESLIRLIKKPANVDKKFNPMNPDPATSWAPHRIFNIGNSQPTPLMTYVEEIEKALGKKAIKEFADMQQGDVKSTSADTTLLNDWIGFKPSTPISKGIAKFVNWYLEFYKVNDITK